MSKNDKNENVNVDETLDTALLDAITVIENLDTEIEDLIDDNGKLNQACYTFLQCFNNDKFNGQTHLQWEINFTKQCNDLGIERKQKNVDEKTKNGIIKSNLKKLDDKMKSRVSKIKRFQVTTVSKAQQKKGIAPIGTNISKTTKWYDIKKAVAPVVDQDLIDAIKKIKKWGIDRINLAIEFDENRNSMKMVDKVVKTTKAFDDLIIKVKSNFETNQKMIELEKKAQANAK